MKTIKEWLFILFVWPFPGIIIYPVIVISILMSCYKTHQDEDVAKTALEQICSEYNCVIEDTICYSKTDIIFPYTKDDSCFKPENGLGNWVFQTNKGILHIEVVPCGEHTCFFACRHWMEVK